MHAASSSRARGQKPAVRGPQLQTASQGQKNEDKRVTEKIAAYERESPRMQLESPCGPSSFGRSVNALKTDAYGSQGYHKGQDHLKSDSNGVTTSKAAKFPRRLKACQNAIRGLRRLLIKSAAAMPAKELK